jgi:hypothetical protein
VRLARRAIWPRRFRTSAVPPSSRLDRRRTSRAAGRTGGFPVEGCGTRRAEAEPDERDGSRRRPARHRCRSGESATRHRESSGREPRDRQRSRELRRARAFPTQVRCARLCCRARLRVTGERHVNMRWARSAISSRNLDTRSSAAAGISRTTDRVVRGHRNRRCCHAVTGPAVHADSRDKDRRALDRSPTWCAGSSKTTTFIREEHPDFRPLFG